MNVSSFSLQDLPSASPGSGYTGHCFNDFNHVDCCVMLGDVAHNENRGKVKGIAYHNQLGHGIKVVRGVARSLLQR